MAKKMTSKKRKKTKTTSPPPVPMSSYRIPKRVAAPAAAPDVRERAPGPSPSTSRHFSNARVALDLACAIIVHLRAPSSVFNDERTFRMLVHENIASRVDEFVGRVELRVYPPVSKGGPGIYREQLLEQLVRDARLLAIFADDIASS